LWLYNALLSYLHARDAANVELQRVNAELESRIEERTKDLTRANEELQQFAYVASHDLQEPLRTITSFTQLLETRYKGRFDEDADEFIGYIVASSRRMTDLINGLLALGRLRKSGQATTPVSFDDLLREAEISLQAAIRESGAEIQSDPLPALVVDKVQFAQVLQNLISNAIKYRRDEAPRIVIRARRDATSWIFSVSDNGRGFNQEFAERIFGLFQRLHPQEIRGTGMGLSIARRILERHGGRIWAESEEGKGSTFFFSLPLSLEKTHTPEPTAVANAAGAGSLSARE
jgi:light-regulated signal transduction histidine kinase (bacteriophytochrome)